jgi:hypothetical protein
MPAKKVPPPATAPDALSDALDQLYGAPLSQFVSLRRELSSALRGRGELPASRLVATATKPTRTAWALNQVARRRPELLHALFEARDAAATAQKQGNADQVRSATRAYRERVVSVVHAGRDALREVGAEMNAVQSRRVGESLQSAAAGGEDARARLLAGRLTQDMDVEDPFAGLEVDIGRVGRRDTPQRPAEVVASPRRRMDDERSPAREALAEPTRQRKIEEERPQQQQWIEVGRQRVAALEAKVREARAVARDAERAARRAQSAADQAQQAVSEAEKRLERARAELRELQK